MRGQGVRKTRGSALLDTKLEAAVSHHQAGRLAEARRLYEEILSEEPKHVVALHLLGVITCQEGDSRQAIALIGQAIALLPNYADAHNNLAWLLQQEGRLDEALVHYSRASMLAPDNPIVRANHGEALLELGRDDEAHRADEEGIEAARKHLELNPGDARALSMGAAALVSTGQKEEGFAWAERAVALAPHETMLMYNVACLYSLAGEPDSAFEYLGRAAEAGHAHRAWLEADSDLDPIRDDPRFQTILDQIG